MNGERSLRRAALRRATLQLVVGVIVLDALAMGVYFFGGVAQASTNARTIFTVIWTGATAITVAVLLKRVRAARRTDGER